VLQQRVKSLIQVDDRRRLSFHFTFDRRRIDIGYAEPRCVSRTNAILRITETHNIELIEE
jgi:hypothetical protein